MQAARKAVGPQGFVLGVDIKTLEPFTENNVRSVVLDIQNTEAPNQILELLPRKSDALLSDVAPNITGIWEVDHARQIDLAQKALDIALETLKPKGHFFAKVFQGDLLDDFVIKVKQHFEKVSVIKPKASRSKSSEMFIIAICMKDRNRHN